jgi:sulfhydrogenase subunit delta
MKKPTLAIASMTCCEGCQVEILNLGKRLLDLFQIFDLGNFAWAEEKKERPSYDIALVEGTPLTEEDVKYLKELRKKSKILVAIGACAHLGGVQEIKNYTEKNKNEKAKYVYPKYQRIQNPKVVPLSRVVKVDYTVPGCPIDQDEFYRVISDIILGREPRIPQRPVCFECQAQGFECLLQKGEPCLGPITLGGCKAICLRSKRFCYGCRGPLPGAGPQIKKHLKNIQKLVGKKYLREIMETYGAEDDFLKIEE